MIRVVTNENKDVLIKVTSVLFCFFGGGPGLAGDYSILALPPYTKCFVCLVSVCVFVCAYKTRIYPWLNTDEARIFDKARTSHFVFSLD